MPSDDDLLQQWFDGDRGAAQAPLARRMAEDPTLVDRVIAHERCVAMLQLQLADGASDPAVIINRLRWRRRQRRLRRAGLTLAVAAVLAIATIWWPMPEQTAVWGRVDAITGAGRLERPPAAQALSASAPHVLVSGARLLVGDRLHLAGESLVIEDRTGARLELRGSPARPAVLQLSASESGVRCRLQRGDLQVTIQPTEATTAWTMATSNVQVMAQGTRFTVATDEETTGIAVRAGHVVVHRPIGTVVQQLDAGESLVFRGAGTELQAVGLDHRPIGWWPGEADRAHDDDLLDRSGNGGHGFLIRPQEAAYVPGRAGLALRLGSRSLVQIHDHPRYDCGSGTIALWAKPARPWREQATAISQPISLFTKMDWDGAAGYELLHASGHSPERWGGRVVLDPAQRPHAIAPMPTGTDWLHLAVTWGDGRLRFYQNGFLQSETVIPDRPVPGNDKRISIGGNYAGLLDDIRLYDVALAPAEILALRLRQGDE